MPNFKLRLARDAKSKIGIAIGSTGVTHHSNNQAVAASAIRITLALDALDSPTKLQAFRSETLFALLAAQRYIFTFSRA